MKFGPVALDHAEGLILGHTVRADGFTFKKGHRLTRADIVTLKNAGMSDITGARLEAGDVGEDEAAAEIARLIAVQGLILTAARTGRCNVEAASPGLVRLDVARIMAVNGLSEAVTVATLA